MKVRILTAKSGANKVTLFVSPQTKKGLYWYAVKGGYKVFLTDKKPMSGCQINKINDWDLCSVCNPIMTINEFIKLID